MGGRKTAASFSPEVKERAVRLVLEHQGEHGSQWVAMVSIAGKIGCTAETLRKWGRQVERDRSVRAGATSSEQTRIKELERENRQLRQANEILQKVSAYFDGVDAPTRRHRNVPVWRSATIPQRRGHPWLRLQSSA